MIKERLIKNIKMIKSILRKKERIPFIRIKNIKFDILSLEGINLLIRNQETKETFKISLHDIVKVARGLTSHEKETHYSMWDEKHKVYLTTYKEEIKKLSNFENPDLIFWTTIYLFNFGLAFAQFSGNLNYEKIKKRYLDVLGKKAENLFNYSLVYRKPFLIISNNQPPKNIFRSLDFVLRNYGLFSREKNLN